MTDKFSDAEQMRLNAFRKNERLRSKLGSFVDNMSDVKPLKNYRYVFEFSIPFSRIQYGFNKPLQFTKTLVTNKSKIFTVKSITSATIAVAAVNEHASARIDMEPWQRDQIIDDPGLTGDQVLNFDWQLRDSGTDGQWQNAPLPANMLLGGAIGPLRLSHGRLLKGGTEITCDLFVTSMGTTGNIGNVSSFTVQLSLFGVEHE